MAFGKRKTEQTEPKVVVVAPTSDTEKFKRLFAIGAQLDKKHETTNSLIRLGSKNIIRIPSISTKLATVDYDMIQTGGIPRGRIVEIFGPPSAGKTTFTLWLIAQAQEQGDIAAFVDAEHALDLGYAENLGVNVDNLVFSQPASGEKALQVVDALVDSLCVGLIVVDSVSALVPEAELEGDMGDNHVGLQARMMSQAMRKLAAKCDKNKVTVIFINQIREKIGVMFGSPETTTGGRALVFYSSIRIDVRRQEAIKQGDVIIGHSVRLKAVKNKVGNPLRETTVDLYYPNTSFPCGFDHIGDLITFASKRGLFEMSGAWYHMDLGNKVKKMKDGKELEVPVGVEQLACGLAKLKERLRDDKKALDIIRKKVAKVAFEVAEVKA